jgi:hypothetical protein
VFLKVKILLRSWRHTWQEKPPRIRKIPTPLYSQPTHSFPMPLDTEKSGGLLHLQAPAPNLLGRCRPPGEQINSKWYPHNHPWDKAAQPLGQTDPHSAKKKTE